MANCSSCNVEIAAGTRWCGVCHTNILNPKIGCLASPGKRLFAFLLDLLVPLVAIFVALFLGIGSSGLLGFGLFAVYAIWAFVLFARGTTPGKNFVGIRVVKEDGSSAGFLTMLIREWIGKAISGLIFSLGFIWILFDRDNQGWHDKLMRTFVVGKKIGGELPPGDFTMG